MNIIIKNITNFLQKTGCILYNGFQILRRRGQDDDLSNILYVLVRRKYIVYVHNYIMCKSGTFSCWTEYNMYR